MSDFVDECALCVRGGDGGAGCVSFRREAHVDRGGPDGGDGGRGGDVWLEADRNVASLLAFRDHPHRRAASGGHGSGRGRHGQAGADLVVKVPEGTVVRAADGERLADLAAHGRRWLAAPGGAGGRGNTRFATNRRPAPRFAEQGEQIAERWLRLELKLLADVALVGLPNAGKSTLISRLSAARPKIADYPFTTLVPNLGVVVTDGGEDFVVADVPGLIEGASEGRGLGHRFLRHIERARALVLLIDLGPAAGSAPEAQLRILRAELGAYRPELLARRCLVVGSKADVAAERLDEADMAVSAVTGAGVAELTGRLAALVREARQDEPPSAAAEVPVVHRPGAGRGADAVSVRRDGAAWLVLGRPAERAVALSDLTDPQAQEYMAQRLRALGVDRELARAGARAGDEVRIGTVSFEYEPEEAVAQAAGSAHSGRSDR
ncbi:MAG: GTPase ObgE [bacterium]|nr:GTPase ObgE [bacterium]MYB23732.1 GTPase ObgE [Acidimicrobiia bacterium]